MIFWYTITETQQQLLTVILGGLFGIMGSMFVEWYKKKRTPYQEKKETTQTMIDGADRLVKASGNLIEILEERLEEERKYFQDRLTKERKYLEDELYKCKKECEEQITKMQEKFIELEKSMEKNNGGN